MGGAGRKFFNDAPHSRRRRAFRPFDELFQPADRGVIRRRGLPRRRRRRRRQMANVEVKLFDGGLRRRQRSGRRRRVATAADLSAAVM